MAADAVQLRPGSCAPQIAEALAPLQEDVGDAGQRLDVVHQGGLAPQPLLGGVGGLIRGMPATLDALDEGGPPFRRRCRRRGPPRCASRGAPRRQGLGERPLEAAALLGELPPDVEVDDIGAHRLGCDGQPLHQQGPAEHDLPVLEGARLALVGVADDVALARRLAAHRPPLDVGGEARAPAALQPAGLELLEDPLRAHGLRGAQPPRPRDPRPRGSWAARDRRG